MRETLSSGQGCRDYYFELEEQDPFSFQDTPRNQRGTIDDNEHFELIPELFHPNIKESLVEQIRNGFVRSKKHEMEPKFMPEGRLDLILTEAAVR